MGSNTAGLDVVNGDGTHQMRDSPDQWGEARRGLTFARRFSIFLVVLWQVHQDQETEKNE